MSEKKNNDEAEPQSSKSEKISVGKWTDRKPPVRKTFDGPRGVNVALRLTFNRRAYADIIAHAGETLDAEVCGALVGEVCKDDEGHFVSIQAAIKGTSARQGKGHVTFTQETWNDIHKKMDKDYPKLQIVGWYHTHPGFGVEISDMDRFVHKNFFPLETQIALVTDPTKGDTAIFVNTGDAIEGIDRFWVEGRECRCRVFGRNKGNPSGENATGPDDIAKVLEDVNTRLSQVTQALDEHRNLFHRFVFSVGVIVCLGVAASIGYTIYSSINSRLEPPTLLQYIPVPVQIGDKTVMMGVTITQWEIPPELNAVYLQLEQMKREAEAKAKAEAMKSKKTSAEEKKPKDIPLKKT